MKHMSKILAEIIICCIGESGWLYGGPVVPV